LAQNERGWLDPAGTKEQDGISNPVGTHMPMMVDIRAARPSDHDLLQRMFVDATLWDPGMTRQSLAELLRVPEIRRYFADWGGPGDTALIADVDGTSAGAAWYRFFRAAEPGYGFVEESIPELGIAVSSEWRGRSIGSMLLEELIKSAKARGCPGLSLSVSAANRARRLYERHGFIDVGGTGGSRTMLARWP
jgi:ribosomal protein S18 acetylase RimI-like enzyme